MTGCDVVALFPDLFVDVDDETRDSIRQTFAMSYLDGWDPERVSVENLLAFERSEIDSEEYFRRSRALAQQRAED